MFTEIDILSPLLNFGIAGIMIIYFIYNNQQTNKSHKTERDQWRADHKEQQEQNRAVFRELKEVIENNTEAVTNLRIEHSKHQ